MRHGWITTLRKDGSPRTSRVWFVERDGAIWVATSLSTWKVRDIRRDPRVSFAVEGVDDPKSAVATLVDIETRQDVLAAFRAEYNGWDAADTTAYGPRVLLHLR